MKKLIKYSILSIILILILLFYLINARANNTWPFNTKIGYYIPDSAKRTIYSVLTSKSKNTLSFFYDLKLNYYQIPNYKFLVYGGGIDNINNKIIYISNSGEISFFDLDSKKFSKNLNDIEGFKSIRDIKISEKENEISILGVQGLENNCGRLILSKYKYNFDKLEMKLTDEEKLWISEENCNYIVKTSGGRVEKIRNSYFVSTGIFQTPVRSGIIKENWSQKMNSSFGKIIKIDEQNNSSIYASGFRNPQGLFVTKKPEKIFATDHGPNGGDEINVIEKNMNYGWPCISFGKLYSKKINDENIYPNINSIDGCDDKKVYKNPIYSFSRINNGISQGVYYNSQYFKKFYDSIIVSSLKGKKLYRFNLDGDKENIISHEEIYIGSRIRDILISKKGKLILITDKGFLVEIEKNI